MLQYDSRGPKIIVKLNQISEETLKWMTECMEKLNNSHITWCEKLNTKEDYTFENLMNGTLEK